MSVPFSTFVNFIKIFIRNRSKLSLMITGMVSTAVYFPIMQLFLPNENLCNFCRYLVKNCNLHFFKIRYRFLFMLFFFGLDSLHARLNSHYKAWSYKKNKHQKIKAYIKSLQEETAVNKCSLTLNLKPFRLQIKKEHSIARKFQNLAV